MSFLVYYLILHLCVSMHACTASRHLGVFHKEFGLITSKTPEVLMAHDLVEGTNYVELKESKLEFPSNERKLGSDIKVQISQEENKLAEGWKNRGRSTMESNLEDSKEAINKSDEDNSITEDVVVMDYAQPHRKPPIHNIQP